MVEKFENKGLLGVVKGGQLQRRKSRCILMCCLVISRVNDCVQQKLPAGVVVTSCDLL